MKAAAGQTSRLRRRGIAIALPVAVATSLLAAAGAGAVLLHALTPMGCIADVPDAAGCGTPAQGLNGAEGVAVSPDGASVYAIGLGDSAIVRFDRAANGALSNQGCVADVGDVAGCGATAQGMSGANGVAVSPDGKSVYVASQSDRAIVRFDRATNGALSNPSCIADVGDVAGCGATAQGLNGVAGVAVSPDGGSVYAVGFGDSALVRFDRAANGALSNPSCFADVGDVAGCGATAQGLNGVAGVAVSTDGKGVYAASFTDNAIVRLDRAANGALSNPSCVADVGDAAGCGATAQGLNGAIGVAVSPDGASVYAVGSDDQAIVRFNRAANGALSNQGCVSDVGAGAGCATTAQGLLGAFGVAVSADGGSVYAASTDDDAIVRFDRAADGALSKQGCVADVGDAAGCGATAQGLNFASGVAVSPDGGSVYAVGLDDDAIVRFARELAPVCNTTSSTGAPGAVQTVALDCSDPNGDPLTIEVAKGPAHGALGAIDQAADTVAYTPDPGFAGADSFDVRASSDGKQSNAATVVIGVQSATGPIGPTGPQGPIGAAGPQGPPGRDATVKCKVKKSKKVKCKVTFTAAVSSVLARARLARHGRTYARARKPVDGGRVELRFTTRRSVPDGRYRLKLTVHDRDGTRTRTQHSLRIG